MNLTALRSRSLRPPSEGSFSEKARVLPVIVNTSLFSLGLGASAPVLPALDSEPVLVESAGAHAGVSPWTNRERDPANRAAILTRPLASATRPGSTGPLRSVDTSSQPTTGTVNTSTQQSTTA